jgi:membrane protease YdiL (CAAX protease family)
MGSAYIWTLILWRWCRRRPILDKNDEPRAKWNSAAELVVLYVAFLCMMPGLLALFQAAPVEPGPLPGPSGIAVRAVVNLGLTLALPLALISRTRPLSAFGISLSNFKNQIQVGVSGYLAAVLPMAISIIVTARFRGEESHQMLLKLWSSTNDPVMISLIVGLATISVPLMEELLYRVVLQGWLSTLIPSSAAIVITALLFSVVHGWKNGAALLPLALILGYVFHRRHSFLSVAVIHSLYNATMLILQRLNPL